MDDSENRSLEKPKRRGGLRFGEGQIINAGGRPKAIRSVIEAARQHSPLAMATLAEIAGDKTQIAGARVMAANILLDRAWGKVSQEIRHTGRDGGPIEHIYAGLDDAELLRIAESDVVEVAESDVVEVAESDVVEVDDGSE